MLKDPSFHPLESAAMESTSRLLQFLLRASPPLQDLPTCQLDPSEASTLTTAYRLPFLARSRPTIDLWSVVLRHGQRGYVGREKGAALAALLGNSCGNRRHGIILVASSAPFRLDLDSIA